MLFFLIEPIYNYILIYLYMRERGKETERERERDAIFIEGKKPQYIYI